MGISLHRDLNGEPGGGLFTTDSETQMKKGSGNGASVRSLREEP